MSLAILIRATATVRTWPDVSTRASRDAWAAKWSGGLGEGSPVRLASRSTTAAAEPGGALIPVPTAVPPSGSSPRRPQRARRRAAACVTWLA